ncbi:glucuronyl/N-acetylglucosaminyl transferase EXT1 [Acrasis kona]|uniref:Glucuronyl/N-acetylglucosaminyl transferase EXT1 n=1 Tax=Acrasis kona TaxID=1008807 RepID=A0AAW2ZEC6_9EUKA
MKVYLYEPLTGFHELKGKILAGGNPLSTGRIYGEVLEAVKSSNFYTEDPNEACFFMAGFDTSCEANKCYPGENLMHQMLHSLKYWNTGNNHILFENSDNYYIPYDPENAITIRTSQNAKYFRSKYDIPIGLTSHNARTFSEQEVPSMSERQFNVSFVGTLYKKYNFRRNLAPLHDNVKNFIILECRDLEDVACNRDQSSLEFEYLLKNSKFGIAAKGVGLHSYRLAEAMAAGAIPIVVADDYVLPFEEVLPWYKFSIRVRENDVLNIPSRAADISEEQLSRMQKMARCVFKEYMSTIGLQVVNGLTLLQRRLNILDGKVVDDSFWHKCDVV